MNMENDHLEKLKKMLENGEIDQKTYDDITERWGNASNTATETTHEKKENSERQRSGKVRISGSGNLSDIYSEELHVSGSAHINGFVDSDVISISGSAKVSGDLKCNEEFEVSGSVAIAGDIDGKAIRFSGSLTGNSLKCKTLDVSGRVKILKDILAEQIEVSGNISSEDINAKIQHLSGAVRTGNVTGEEIRISGKIEANDVVCKRFEMEIYGSKSEMKKLKAEAVEIKYGHGRFSGFFQRNVNIDEINCRRAFLQGVISKSIRGDEIIVGEGSEIEYAEGRIIKLEGGTVKEKKIVP